MQRGWGRVCVIRIITLTVRISYVHASWLLFSASVRVIRSKKYLERFDEILKS